MIPGAKLMKLCPQEQATQGLGTGDELESLPLSTVPNTEN